MPTPSQVTSRTLDHLGIVAGLCQDLQIARRINDLLDTRNQAAKVTAGDAVVAMILSGMGFTKRTLYMTPRFLQGKPVALLFGKDLRAEDFNDDTLGRALDAIAEFGPQRLFGSIAFAIGQERGLIGSSARIDTTSVSLEGEYDRPEEEGMLRITHGYSKDHRQDLKQFILSLTVTGEAALPIWSETLDGNASDRTSFHETIARVRAFQKGLEGVPEFLWVADSALYSKDKLLSAENLRWVTRVPETVKECRELVESDEDTISWTTLPNGYRISIRESSFGELHQRWLLVFSQQAFERERASFERALEKKEEKLATDLWHLENKKFATEELARAGLLSVQDAYPLHHIDVRFVPCVGFSQRGRPPGDATRQVTGFSIEVTRIRFNQDEADKKLNTKGRFVLATNELDGSALPDAKILAEYKLQQDVERAHNFLKGTEFGLTDIYLKSPSRIAALMAVMTLCLMVYNVAQFELRQQLKTREETLPNQLNKPTSTPTLRWVLQMFMDIQIVIVDDQPSVVTNITPLREKVLRLFPPAVRRIYGRDAPTAHS
jgi:transposase